MPAPPVPGIVVQRVQSAASASWANPMTAAIQARDTIVAAMCFLGTATQGIASITGIPGAQFRQVTRQAGGSGSSVYGIDVWAAQNTGALASGSTITLAPVQSTTGAVIIARVPGPTGLITGNAVYGSAGTVANPTPPPNQILDPVESGPASPAPQLLLAFGLVTGNQGVGISPTGGQPGASSPTQLGDWSAIQSSPVGVLAAGWTHVGPAGNNRLTVRSSSTSTQWPYLAWVLIPVARPGINAWTDA